MPGRFARKTQVPVDKSKAEIESTLANYGADQFMSGWDQQEAILAFRLEGRHMQFRVPMPSREDPAFTTYLQGSVQFRRTESAIQERYEQAVRQRWRALLLIVKAALEAVELEIVSLDQAFLPYIVLPNGSTVADWMVPQVESAYLNGSMPDLLQLAAPK